MTLLALAATVAALVTPAGGSTLRRDGLPTRLPGTLTVGVDIGTIGLATFICVLTTMYFRNFTAVAAVASIRRRAISWLPSAWIFASNIVDLK